MFDQETEKKLSEKDPALILELQKGIEKRHQAAKLKVQADELIEEANGILIPLMTVLEVTSVKAPGMGTLNFQAQSKTTSFSKKIMSEYLLSHGVNAELVARAQKTATKEGFKDIVKFTLEKTS